MPGRKSEIKGHVWGFFWVVRMKRKVKSEECRVERRKTILDFCLIFFFYRRKWRVENMGSCTVTIVKSNSKKVSKRSFKNILRNIHCILPNLFRIKRSCKNIIFILILGNNPLKLWQIGCIGEWYLLGITSPCLSYSNTWCHKYGL